MKVINKKNLGLAFIFGIIIFVLLKAQVYFKIPGTNLSTDPREILILIGTAIVGPVSAVIIAILGSVQEPNTHLTLYVILKHTFGVVLVGFIYKKYIYEKLPMPFFIAAWIVLVFAYYFIFYWPGLFIAYYFFPSLYREIIPGDAPFLSNAWHIFSGWIPEFLFTVISTLLIFLALPSNYRKPLWGSPKEPHPIKMKLANNKMLNTEKFSSSLAVRLTLWFIILAVIPVLIMGIYIKKNVSGVILRREGVVLQELANEFKTRSRIVDPKTYYKLLKQSQQSREGDLFVIGLDGNYHIDPTKISHGKNAFDDYPPDIIKQIMDRKQGYAVDEINNVCYGFSYVEAGIHDFIIVTVSDKKSLEIIIDNLESTTFQKLGWGVVFISLGLIFILWVIIKKPLSKLTLTMLEFGKGNFASRVPAEEMHDEMKVLADSFNLMADRITDANNALHYEIYAHKMAEEELRENELKFKSYIDNAPSGVLVANSVGKFIEVNPAASKLLGYTESELLNLSVPEILGGNSSAEGLAHFKRVSAEGFAWGDILLKRKNGQDVWTSIDAVRISANKLMAFIQDITERKLAQEEIRNSEKNLAITLNSIGDGVISTDIEGNIVRMNPVAEKLCGWKFEEAKGKRLSLVFNITNAETGESVSNPVEQVLETGKIIGLANHTLLTSRDGTEYQIADSAAPIKNEDGKTVGVVLVFSDVTQEYAMQQAVRDNEMRLRRISDAAFEGIGFTENGVIIDVNKQLTSMLGYTPEEVIGKKVLDFTAVESRELVSARLKASDLGIDEFKAVKKDGTIIDVETRGSILDVENRQIRVIAIRDITQQKRLVEELKESEIRFRKLFDDSLDPIMLLKDGYFIDFNSSVLSILGFASREELLGKTPWDISPEYQPDGILSSEKASEMIEIALRNENNLFEWIHKKKDGSELSVEVLLAPIVLRGEKLIHVTFHDLTKRKLAEAGLVASEKKFREMTELLPQIVFEYDSSGTLKYVNKSGMELFGFTPEDVENGQNILSTLVPEDRASAAEKFQKVLEGEKSIGTEYTAMKKDGSAFPVAVYTARIEENGRAVGIRGMAVDITESRKSKEEISLARAQLQSILDSATRVAIISTDRSGIIKHFNAGAEQMLGYNSAEIVDKQTPSFFHLESEIATRGEELSKIFNRKMAGFDVFTANVNASTSETREWTYVRKNGVHITVSLVITAILNEKKELIGYLGIASDISEEKVIKVALTESEEKYRTLMENMNEAVMMVDNDDKILFVNKKFTELLGYKPEEIIGEIGHLKLLNEKDHSLIQKANAERIKGVNSQYELTFISKKGDEIEFLVNGAPLFDSDGEVIGSIGTMTDITEIKKNQEELIRAAERFRILTEKTGTIVYDKNLISGTILRGGAIEDVLGYTEEEYSSLTIQQFEMLIHDEDRERISANEKSILSRPGNFLWEYRLKNRAGTYVHIEDSGIVLSDSTGISVRMLGSMKDISERKRADEKLKDAFKFIQYVVDSIPTVIIVVDENLEVTQHNRAALIFNGMSGEEKNLFVKFRKLHFLKDIFEKAVNSNSLVSQNAMLITDEGETEYYSVMVYPLAANVSPGYVLLVDNITDRRRMEQLMIQNEKMTSISGLAAGMAHEINNPLGTIVQGCQNIIRRTGPELSKNREAAERVGIEMEKIQSYFQEREIDHIIESIRNAAGKASEIIKNMLQFSRKSESKKVNYRIEKLIDETIELARNDYNLKKKYDFRSIKIIREYEEGLPELWVTVTEIQQVIFNLLQNSAHALCGEGSQTKEPIIKIKVSCEGEKIRIELEDNGPGMNEKIRSRVFEPFFTTKEIGEGTGLGLSVSYMIVNNNHNGSIEVKSTKGVGTVFQIKLPIERGKG